MSEQVKFSRTCKELMDKELKEQFESHPNFVVTNYFGLSSNDLNELRQALKKLSSEYLVVKNTIAKRVLKNIYKDQSMESIVSEGTGIGFIGGDVVETAKRVVGFSKNHEAFKIRGAYIEGQALEVGRFKELASLPSRQVLLAMLVTAMQAPISGFATTLNGVIRKFVYAIKAIKDKKEETSK